MTNKKLARAKGEALLAALLLVLTLLAFVNTVFAVDPTGAVVTNYTTSQKNTSAPGQRNDSRGTITTVLLTGIQQDTKWKAYVGNVSATFTLDDSADYTIYSWNINSFTGQVYASRNSSITWSTINCTEVAEKTAEGLSVNHSASSEDGLNRTFTSQIHREFYVGDLYIKNSSCYSIATYVNDASQSLTESVSFQEVLLSDGSGRMVYTTFVENDIPGYRSDGTTYDFQMIVAEDPRGSIPITPYYFYVELTGN
ncbi:hypothetical protein JW930_07175 [Candidatus Woesearchaeota archaeon]|nr:hypothetical protein [Candidatus Woesearchaeota archaeon]